MVEDLPWRNAPVHCQCEEFYQSSKQSDFGVNGSINDCLVTYSEAMWGWWRTGAPDRSTGQYSCWNPSFYLPIPILWFLTDSLVEKGW